MSATIRKPAEGRTVAVVGDVYRYLVSGDETGGKYALLEAFVGPGGGPPPHIHSREEEGFYILDGEITFNVDGKRIVAGPGMFANVSIGTLHSFKNESGKPVRMSSTGTTVIPYFAVRFPQKTNRFGASYGKSERSFGRMIGFWTLLKFELKSFKSPIALECT